MKHRAAERPPPATVTSPDTVVAAFDIAETGEVNLETIQIAIQTTDTLEMKPMSFFAELDLTT